MLLPIMIPIPSQPRPKPKRRCWLPLPLLVLGIGTCNTQLVGWQRHAHLLHGPDLIPFPRDIQGRVQAQQWPVAGSERSAYGPPHHAGGEDARARTRGPITRRRSARHVGPRVARTTKRSSARGP